VTLTGLATRNLMRNKTRTILTVLGVAIAVIAFVLLRTVVNAWTVAADYAQKDRIVTRHKVTFIMQLPKKYIEDIRQDPNVEAATYANWFGGKDPKHETEFFASIAVDPKTYFDVAKEITLPEDQKQAFYEDRSGAVVGDAIAQKLGWKIGDKVTLDSSIYPAMPDKAWTFTIRGIYTATMKSADRSSFLFHWDMLNEGVPEKRKDQIGWVISRVKDSSKVAAISVAIDKRFDERDIQTLTQDEHAFQASFLAGFSAVITALDGVSIVILAIMALILGNTIAMGVRERTSEYGTLRAIGFLPRHLVMFILGEAAALSGIGGALGLLIAYPFVEQGLGRWLEENMGAFFPYFRIGIGTAVVAFGASVGLGLLAGALPARGASKLKVTEALRRVA
jgi:putative ABC transport system permease protein